MVFPMRVFRNQEFNLKNVFEKIIYFWFRSAPPHPPPRRKMIICRPGRLVLDPWYDRPTLGGGVEDVDWRGLHPAGARWQYFQIKPYSNLTPNLTIWLQPLLLIYQSWFKISMDFDSDFITASGLMCVDWRPKNNQFCKATCSLAP